MKTNAQDTFYELILDGTRIKGEDSNGRKYDFISFSAWDKNGKKCSIKFTKAVENVPKEAGAYLLRVNKKDMNKDKQSRYNQYWVKAYDSLTPYEGQAIDNEDDLPF